MIQRADTRNELTSSHISCPSRCKSASLSQSSSRSKISDWEVLRSRLRRSIYVTRRLHIASENEVNIILTSCRFLAESSSRTLIRPCSRSRCALACWVLPMSVCFSTCSSSICVCNSSSWVSRAIFSFLSWSKESFTLSNSATFSAMLSWAAVHWASSTTLHFLRVTFSVWIVLFWFLRSAFSVVRSTILPSRYASSRWKWECVSYQSRENARSERLLTAWSVPESSSLGCWSTGSVIFSWSSSSCIKQSCQYIALRLTTNCDHIPVIHPSTYLPRYWHHPTARSRVHHDQ